MNTMTTNMLKRSLYRVTTPIFYVNSKPHVGHLYSVLLADVDCRWKRFNGCDSWLSTGTDEHGQKIQKSAQLKNISPQQLCDMMSAEYRSLFDIAGVKYDEYVRTTQRRHQSAVQSIWTRLRDLDLIYKGSHSGWYCIADETFYTDQQIMDTVDDDGNKIKVSVESGRQVEWIQEDNYMFKLSEFKDRLIKWITGGDNERSVIYPQSQRNLILSLLQSADGLKDLSVSRPSQRAGWGIQVPDDPTQTVYVWFDALINYLTATGFPSPVWNLQSPKASIEYNATIDNHIVGKDILKFHAIIYPAMLMALNLPLPRRITSHSHITVNGQKISKSSGNAPVEINQLINTYGVDAVRYHLIRETEGGIQNDFDYSESMLRIRYQIELADQLGNLLSRCISKSMNSKLEVPELHKQVLDSTEQKLIDELNRLPELVSNHAEDCEYGRYLQVVVNNLRMVNQYVGLKEPWKLFKQTGDSLSQKNAYNCLYIALESLRISSLMLQPVMPQKTTELLDKLSVPPECRHINQSQFQSALTGRKLAPGHKIHLFPRLPIN
ncbi:hypothetical protein MP228_009113 [Amoeboaphelidium protococcarum]|nr:hypothetical protein MP228_009113 [Amoeboaphelidium protococcarum]